MTTKVLTVRVSHDLLAKAEARAVSLGLDRAKYVRGLIEEDLALVPDGRGQGFVSEDLVGVYEALESGGAASNAQVREVMRKRQSGKGKRVKG